MSSIQFDSIARHIPPRVITNDDMAKIVETSDEWISSRTGIRRRHFAEEGTTSVDQAFDAASKAMEQAGSDGSDICAVVYATFAPDMRSPACASTLLGRLGITQDAISFDLNAGCTGFMFALHVANGLLLQHPGKRVLLVASELISKVMDFTRRETCVLFGDGAAAAVLSLREDGQDFFIGGTQPDDTAITVPAFTPEGGAPGIGMEGQKVFKFACGVIEENINKLVDISGLSLDEIDHVVCHQANARIINHTIKHLKADPAKFFMNIEEFGNTSAASIPIALAQMSEEGLLKRGDKVMLVGFGAGLVHGGMLFTW